MAWMKTILFVVLLHAVTATASLAESDQEVYAEVDRIFAHAEEKVSENLEAYIKANQAPLTQARADMAELIARLNKDGRSQIATTLQKRLNTLEDTVQKKASNKVPIIALPQKKLAERIAGKWTNPNWHLVYVFEADGKFREEDKASGRVNATGSIVESTDEVAEVKLSNNHRIRAMPAGNDSLALLVWDPAGKPVLAGLVMERAK